MEYKALPKNLEAEQGVLGIIINYSKAIEDVILDLKPHDFYDQRNIIIFTNMLEMYTKDINIDLITLSEELRKTGNLQDIGGISYLSAIMGSVTIADSIKEYTAIVREKSARRKLIAAAQDLISKSYDSSSKVKEIITIAEDTIYTISENKESKVQKISDSLERTISNIEKIYQQGGGLIGISSGFSKVDKCLNGLQRGDFIILAARPSMGKTAFALNICCSVGKNNKTAMFSLEMSEEQITQRMLSFFTGIELSKLRSGMLEDREWKRLAEYSSLLASRKITIDDTAALTVNDIKAKCRKLKIKEGLDVVVIDYLQLIESSSRSQSREQEISKISRSLKNMAKELDITVIALSQLSRAPEQRPNHRPILSDLRESGSIEQDADVVMFLYRDEYYNIDTEDKNIAECIIAKNRNGQVGTAKLTWIGQLQRFGDLDVVHR